MPRQRRGIRGDAPQGYLFRSAPLRGHRPLRTVYRKRMRIPPGGQSRPPLHPVSQRQMHYQNQTSGQRPPPTFAASRQRRDLIIATPQGRVSKGEGSQPLPFGRFKGKRFLRKGGNRNPPFLKPFFGYFLSGKKVTRRRHKGGKSHRAGQSPAPTLRLPKAYTLSIRADRAVRPYKGLKNTPPEAKRTKTTGRAPPQHHKRAPRHRRGALYAICFS